MWTAPEGSHIVSGDGTTSVVLDFDTNFKGEYLIVKAVNNCGDGQPAERWITAKPLPGPIGEIHGDQNFCQGTTDITFSVDPVDNAASYEWHMPTGFMIQSDPTAASVGVKRYN